MKVYLTTETHKFMTAKIQVQLTLASPTKEIAFKLVTSNMTLTTRFIIKRKFSFKRLPRRVELDIFGDIPSILKL